MRIVKGSLCALLFLGVATVATALDETGIELRLEPVAEGSATVVVDMVWTRGAAEASARVRGAWAMVAESSRPVRDEKVGTDAGDPGFNATWSNVEAGDRVRLEVDLRGIGRDDRVWLIVERRNQPLSWQLVTSLEHSPDGLRLAEPRAYRITHFAEDEMRPVAGPSADGAVNQVEQGSFLVEPVLSIAAPVSVFLEDAQVKNINDGPTDCSPESSDWSSTYFYVGSAPVGAVSEEITVHVTISHAVMADLQVAMFYDQNVPGGQGRFLWYNAAGVNLDRDFTRDYAGHTLPGLGLPVNGYYTLGVRDCNAGTTGTLDYWSLLVTYDGTPTIDLVADSVSASPGTVAPGGSASLTFAGRVAGAGTVGGSFTLGFYLSTDTAVDASDVVLSRRTGSWGTNPGDLFGESGFGVTVPATMAPGTYYLVFMVDDANVISEINESNNLATFSPFTVGSSGAPNLVAQTCAVTPASVLAGGNATLSWYGRNSGAVASGAFTRKVYLSNDPQFSSGSDSVLLTASVPAGWPAGGANAQYSDAVTIPGNVAAGSYYVGVFLDSAGAVAESNEGDNWCSSAITVSGGSGTGATRWLLPSAASSPGVGTSDWRSQIAVANPTGATRQASLYYVAKGSSWPGTLLSGPHSIAPGRSVYLEDPLLTLNPTSGLVYVTLDAAGPVVTSRVYNLAADGSTFGQGIPAIALDGATAPAELVLPMIHSAPGQFRTNLGLVQTSAGSFQVEVSVYSSAGALLATKSFTRSSAFDQINNLFDNLGIGTAAIHGAWVRVRLVSGSPQFWTCYASVVDERTGDPTYVAPVENVAAR